MKRWIVLLLILLLTLSACGTELPDNTTDAKETVNTTQQATVPPVSLYKEGSALEKNTQGAVRIYTPEEGGITGILKIGGDLAVFTFDGEGTNVTRITATDGIVRGQSRLEGMIYTFDGSIAASENKLAYYNSKRNCVMLLDGSFRELDRVIMPEVLTGNPKLSYDLTTAYYTIGTEIHAINLDTGIPRLVCRLNAQQLQLQGLLFDDTILYCRVTDMDDRSYAAFYSAENGQLLGSDNTLTDISSGSSDYLVRRLDGAAKEILLGGEEKELRSFLPSDAYNTLCLLPGISGVLEISHGETGTVLAVCDMESGKALGSVELAGVTSVSLVTEDPNGDHLWFCVQDPETAKDVLCRWDYKSAGADNQQRIGVRYTAENPDTDGLAECEQMAAEIGKKYYVNILINAAVVTPKDYTVVTEYQVAAYKKALQTLDAAMAKFPDKFFKTVGTSSKNGKLTISLVRDLVPGNYNLPEPDLGLQFWIKESAYLALETDENIEHSFYRALCRAMDTYVNARSSHYDYWTMYNPEGFTYDENYYEYKNHDGSPYFSGESMAFIDAYCMTYPYEDRATVMAYAMTDGCAHYFESAAMQEKLTLLCKSIRRAFGWRYYEGTFPWEQYLKESQAYVRK